MEDKQKILIMLVEDTTTRLKLIIQQGIATNLSQAIILSEANTLISETEKKLKDQTKDKEFIEEQIKGLNLLLVSWMNNYLLGLNKIANANKSSILKECLDNYKLLNKEGTPIKTLRNGGITLVSQSNKDLFLANEGITNIRDLMTNPQEGGVGRYVDYGKKLREQISQFQEEYALDPASFTDRKGNKKNLRAMAEIKVRYDLITDDLKGKNAKYVVATAHPNASERCSWWQGKIFKVDLDIESRGMHQYKGKPIQTVIEELDGQKVYSLKQAVENGFLSYNCQHRLIKYYKGIKPPKYNLIEVEKKRNETTIQRSLENKIRQTKMIESVNGRNSLIERKNPFTKEMQVFKASDYSQVMQDYYKDYCNRHGLTQYTWRLRITQEERGNITPRNNPASVEKIIETPKETKQPEIEFTKDEMDAVESYVSGDTMYVNQLLRRNEELTNADKALIKDLDNATSKELVKETKLYRSVDSSFIFGNLNENDYENLEQYVKYGADAFDKGSYSQSLLRRSQTILNNAIDKTVVDKGFLSTTTDKKIATEFQYFTGAEHPLVMELEIPKDNVHGFPVYKYFEVEDNPQKEILLERGLSMKITDISFISEEEVGTQLYVKAKIERGNKQ